MISDREQPKSPAHVGLPVAGYQPQSSDKVAAVNLNKEIEEMCLRRLDELKNMVEPDPNTNSGVRSVVDQRWLQIGRTSLEQAFMAINRSVFQPSRIKLPIDTE